MLNILKKKSKGNVTTIFLGQMFLILLITYAMFSFKGIMLNTITAFLDDTIVDSLLASEVVNLSEYGRSNQLVIYDDTDFVNENWNDYETAILLSELNYDSEVLLHSSALPQKKYIYENTSTGRRNKSEAWQNDVTKIFSVNRFISTFNYNVSNGAYTNDDRHIKNTLGTLSASVGGEMNVPKTVLDKYILGRYMKDAPTNATGVAGTNAMDISRLDQYDIYRAELAERKVYMSDFFEVRLSDRDSELKSTFPTADIYFKQVNTATLGTKLSTSSDYNKNVYLSTLADFDMAYEPEANVANYYSKLQRWKILRKKYLQDIGGEGTLGYGESYYGYLNHALNELSKSVGSNQQKVTLGNINTANNLQYPLICYINTHTTFQGPYKKNRVAHRFFFNVASGSDSTYAFEGDKYNVHSTYQARAITSEEIYAPIAGYGVYSFKSNTSEFNYTPGCTYKYYGTYIGDSVLDSTGKPLKSGNVIYDSSKHRYAVQISSPGKMKNYKLLNTSAYTEVTFNITTFMIFTDNSINFHEAPVKRVTMARLTDIDVK